MRLLICAGGTGGGVYPALAVLQALNDRVDQVLWIGAEGGIEADMVKRENIAFEAIPAAGIHGIGLESLPGNILRLTKGYFASRQNSQIIQTGRSPVYWWICSCSNGFGRNSLPIIALRPGY